jgi:hypothetical protein
MTQAAWSRELSAGYAAEAALYRQALEQSEQLAGTPNPALLAETALTELAALLEQVDQIEQRLAPIKQLWRAAGGVAEGPLSETLTLIADLIQQLRACLDDVQRDARRQRAELIPALDDEIRRRQMQRAYGAARVETPHSGGFGDAP